MCIQLNYTEKSVISTLDVDNSTTFKITKTELYVPVVTLHTEENNKLNKLLLESESSDSLVTIKNKDNKFKRTVFWNEYKGKIEDIVQAHNDNNYKRSLLDTANPGVNRLVVNPNENNIVDGNDCHRKYFLSRVDIKDYNVLTDGRNFYDQHISDHFKKYEELRKVMTGRGEDFTINYLIIKL